MSQIEQEVQKLNPSAEIFLYTLDCRVVGGSIINFTNSFSNELIKFGGVSFQYLPFQFDGLETSGVGALPRPTLSIAEPAQSATGAGIVHALVNTWGDLSGSTLSRYRTFARFLDGQPEADPTAFYGPDVFEVDRISQNTPAMVTWELAATVDQQGRKIGRPIIRDTCRFRYREWNPLSGTWDYTKAKCPYTGSSYFDINDNSVASPDLDKPSRKLSCCRVRFGVNGIFPTGAFPGVLRGIE